MYINNFLETSIEKRKYNRIFKKELDKCGIMPCFFDGWYYYYYDTYSLRNMVDSIPFYMRWFGFLCDVLHYIYKVIVG